MDNPFSDPDVVIFRYTRAQAIKDGVLVDVTAQASRRQMFGGFNGPNAPRQLAPFLGRIRPHFGQCARSFFLHPGPAWYEAPYADRSHTSLQDCLEGVWGVLS
jgi:hypothetical protein